MPTTWGDSVFLAISNAFNTLLGAIPLVIGALLILLIGWILSGFAARIVTGLLRNAGADRLFAQHGGAVYGPQSANVQPSVIGGEVVKWLIRFVFIVAAANTLGMTQVSELLNQVLLWIPNLIVALVILLLAPLLARFVRGLIQVGAGEMGFSNASFLGWLAEVAIVAFAVIIAIKQVGIAGDLVNILFMGVVAALAIAFGLAFGLGGREVAAELTRSWYTSSSAATRRIAANAADSETAHTPRPTAETQRPTEPPRRPVDAMAR